jgi:hypothetical protein
VRFGKKKERKKEREANTACLTKKRMYAARCPYAGRDFPKKAIPRKTNHTEGECFCHQHQALNEPCRTAQDRTDPHQQAPHAQYIQVKEEAKSSPEFFAELAGLFEKAF